MTIHRRVRHLFCPLVLTCTICVPLSVQAANYYWNCTSDANWNDASCWNPSGPPSSSSDAYIGAVSGATTDSKVTIDSAATAYYLHIDNAGSIYHANVDQTAGTLSTIAELIGETGYGSFSQSGGTNSIYQGLILGSSSSGYGAYSLSSGNLSASTELVGSVGQGYFGQSGGSNSVGDYLSLGYSGGSIGTYTMDGGTLDVTHGLYVGGSSSGSGGKGTLIVNDGATATAGSLTVWNGSSSITTGTTASSTGGLIDIHGALTLQGGAKATSYGGTVDVGGLVAGSPPTNTIRAHSATVTGTGSLWDTGYFSVGLDGSGTATVANGGEVRSAVNTFVGVNNAANGTLNVNAGGTVDTGANGYVGYNSGATGAVTVGGTNALWSVASGLYIGGSSSGSGGTGALTVNSGGKVTAGTLTVWNGSSGISTGDTASNTGGVINIANALTLQNGATATSFFGIADDVSAGSTSMIHAASATLSGTGTLWDTGNFIDGFKGTGTVTVGSGATVRSAQHTGVGQNSGSTGTLNINAGGTVDTLGDGDLGYYAGATGTVIVGGADAQWNVAHALYVGGSHNGAGGTGILTVNDGGTVTAASLTAMTGTSHISTGSVSSTTGGIIDLAGALTLEGGSKASAYYGMVDNGSSIFTNLIQAQSATISDTGSVWNTGYFYTGYNGSGTTTVASGGTVKSASDTAVGYNNGSNGTLNINAGGTVLTGGEGDLGYSSGASGAVTVGGLWNVADSLYVGGDSSGSGGAGTLTVDDAGEVDVGNLTTPNLSLTVWNANSSISTGDTTAPDPTNPLYGPAGGIIYAPKLILNGGGTATSFYGAVDDDFVAAFPGNVIQVPTATISGTGSLWNTGNFFDGYSGAGTITVADGGQLTSNYYTFVGYTAGSSGTLNVGAGGTVETGANAIVGGLENGASGTATVGGGNALWNVNGILIVGGGTTGTADGAATLTANDGGTVTAGSLAVGNAASSISTGTTASSTGGVINVADTLYVQGGGTATSYYGTVDSAYADSSASIHAGNSATISGTGSLWQTRRFTVGHSGSGTTSVSGGGTLSAAGQTVVGLFNGSDGTLNINANGTVDSTGEGLVGVYSGATGAVTVGGSNAVWNVANGLYVGGTNSANQGGTGTLTVNEGGTVNAGSLTVWNGNSSISSVLSQFGGVIDVAGSLTLLGGGTATGYYGIVDSAPSTYSRIQAQSVSISGSGSLLNLGLLVDGSTNSGTITVANGGKIQTISDAAFGQNGGSTGTLDINAGGMVDIGGGADLGSLGTGEVTVGGTNASLHVAQLMTVGGMTGTGSTGILTVNDGATVNAATVGVFGTGTINMNGGFMSTGTLDLSTAGAQFHFAGGTLAPDTVVGDLVNQGGTLAPGASPGTTHITGDYTQDAAATLAIQIGGLTPGSEFDVLNVDGTANLGGTLDVSLYDLGSGLFTPSLGDSFDILSASSLTGTFDTLTLAALGDGLGWNVSYLLDPNGTDFVQLNVVSAVPLPASLWLFASGLLGLIGVSRRRAA